MISLIGIILYIVLIVFAIKYINKLLDKINKETKEETQKIIRDLEQLDKDIQIIQKHFNEVDMDLPYDDVLKQCDELKKLSNELINSVKR